jgi:hypothetical protein
MKITVKQLRAIVCEVTLLAAEEQSARPLILVPFVCRGTPDRVSGFEEIITISESETEGNRSSYVAWKWAEATEEDDEALVAEADALNSRFSHSVKWMRSSERLPSPPYVKSHHVLVHLVGPDITIYTSDHLSNGYMFDDMDCTDSLLRDLGIPI